MKTTTKMLSLKVEVLKTLSDSEVAQVQGGGSLMNPDGGRVPASGVI